MESNKQTEIRYYPKEASRQFIYSIQLALAFTLRIIIRLKNVILNFK